MEAGLLYKRSYTVRNSTYELISFQNIFRHIVMQTCISLQNHTSSFCLCLKNLSSDGVALPASAPIVQIT